MAQDRVPVKLDIEGVTITALSAGDSAAGRPVIAALHGGTYTAKYFDVAGSGQGSFMDVAAAAGYRVVSFDRPGYGGSSALLPAENTFARHAQLLAPAIAQVAGDAPVVLVGHSIGGMIALMIAGARPGFRLIGASVTGMGAVIRRGGAADALASLPPDETIDLPYDQRDMVFFGPAGTFTADAVEQGHGSYGPTPVRELIAAPRWADDVLPALAGRIDIPVHNELAEFDALWDSTPENVIRFARMLTGAPFVDASIARNTGHSIDHHILGHALHLRQLAFVEECAWRFEQNGG